jgi:hypothetical protein
MHGFLRTAAWRRLGPHASHARPPTEASAAPSALRHPLHAQRRLAGIHHVAAERCCLQIKAAPAHHFDRKHSQQYSRVLLAVLLSSNATSPRRPHPTVKVHAQHRGPATPDIRDADDLDSTSSGPVSSADRTPAFVARHPDKRALALRRERKRARSATRPLVRARRQCRRRGYASKRPPSTTIWAPVM